MHTGGSGMRMRPFKPLLAYELKMLFCTKVSMLILFGLHWSGVHSNTVH